MSEVNSAFVIHWSSFHKHLAAFISDTHYWHNHHSHYFYSCIIIIRYQHGLMWLWRRLWIDISQIRTGRVINFAALVKGGWWRTRIHGSSCSSRCCWMAAFTRGSCTMMLHLFQQKAMTVISDIGDSSTTSHRHVWHCTTQPYSSRSSSPPLHHTYTHSVPLLSHHLVTVLRPIGKVNGEAQILTPCKIYTP